jgi:predicted RNA binding protein YcfA (HicA-like mRNA interferase family)
MSEKLPRVDCQDLIRAIKRAGFVEERQRGSHLHLKRHSDNRRVTVPVHKGRIVPIGTLKAILRDADINVEKFRELLS